MNKQTYELEIECSNCDYRGKKELPFGEEAASGMGCPNCGCKTASKTPPGRHDFPTLPYTLPGDNPGITFPRGRLNYWGNTYMPPGYTASG